MARRRGVGQECSPLNQMEISIKYAARCLRLSSEVSLGKQGEREGEGERKGRVGLVQAKTLPKGQKILVDSSATTLPEAFPFV